MGNNGSTNSFPKEKRMTPLEFEKSNNDNTHLHKNEKDHTPVKSTDRHAPQFSGYANGRPNSGSR